MGRGPAIFSTPSIVFPQRCQRIDAQINSNLAVVLGRFGVNGPRFHSDAHEPSIRDFGHRRRKNLSLKAQFLAHRNPTDMRQANLLTIHLEMVVANGKPVVSALGLEAGILALLLEKVFKRFPQILDSHLWSTFRHFQHPRKFFFLQRVEFSTQLHFARVGYTRVHRMH